MIRYTILATLAILSALLPMFSFSPEQQSSYQLYYQQSIQQLQTQQQELILLIQRADLNQPAQRDSIKNAIRACRLELKSGDFWFRYLAPLAHKKMNGPLPVEWETEVFEKYEPPYRREGAGLTLAYQYLDESPLEKQELQRLIEESEAGLATYRADSITRQLDDYHHFFLCNRLFLLNLAAIYTTGFECPEPADVIPELRYMLSAVHKIYIHYNQSFPQTPLTASYLALYQKTLQFVSTEPQQQELFNHYRFIKQFVNPLFILNQQMIQQYQVSSKNLIDYALNKQARSIFDKKLYHAQQPKGIFARVTDSITLAKINHLGKLLFYDPILSANNERSCASCHNPQTYFTDTINNTPLHFNRTTYLPRNTPTLLNAQYNHLIMTDGKHLTLQEQTIAVITNPDEMSSTADNVVAKVLSCSTYKKAFQQLLIHTPQEKQITIQHIASAITYYYSKFSQYKSPFDEAMETNAELSAEAQHGFNLFMSKAQCATCHFVPQFNGVKPPYAGSEFEVLGTPADNNYTALSNDKGRYLLNPAIETLGAFRTGSIRNSMYTGPYMHNGVFKTMDEVLEFYNGGGGAGRGLSVNNQTLSSDSLQLSALDKQKLIAFITSLNERVIFESAPTELPLSKDARLNTRKIGGTY